MLLVPADSLAQKPLGDIAFDVMQKAGMNVEYAAMDFAAWMEVYLGGQWHTFDARNNTKRTEVLDLVNTIRTRVDQWRTDGWPGVTIAPDPPEGGPR